MGAVVELERNARSGSQNSVTKGDASVPPWRSWPIRGRVDRCVRFIERLCVVPTGYGASRLMTLHPFQREAIGALLEDGVKSAAWQVCRGNGKSTLIAAIALWAVCDEPDFPVVPIIAGDMKQVERTLLKPIVGMIKLQPEFHQRLHTYRAAGDKRVVCWWNGGEILPLPADVDRLQGLQPTVAIVDEGEVVPWDVYWVLRQGGGKRPGSTILMIGTPGPDLESALYKFRALVAEDGSIGRYLENSAPVDVDTDDPAGWEQANPAIEAGFLERDTVAVEARAAQLDELVDAEFRMRRLGHWPDGDGPLTALGRALRKCEDPEVKPSGPLVFAADIGPDDNGEAWIVAVGNGVLEVVDHGPGTAWLPARLSELVERHGGLVAVDRYGPIGARLEDIRRLVPTHGGELNATEMMAASARFQEDVLARVPKVHPHEALRKAVAGAQRFGSGDAWRFARKRSTYDIAPLVAASVGWWVYANGAVPGVN